MIYPFCTEIPLNPRPEGLKVHQKKARDGQGTLYIYAYVHSTL